MECSFAHDLSLLQGLAFVDSFFPSGGYAHSFGLETAIQEGAVKNSSDLEVYLHHWLHGGVGCCDGAATAIAHRAFQESKIEKIMEADWELDAMKPCRESREASRQMGRQTLRVAGQRANDPVIQTLFRLADQHQTPAHQAVVLGVILGASGWSAQASVQATLYQTVVGWVSAGLRLLPLGQLEGQRIIHGLLPVIAKIAAEVKEASLPDMMCWAALHEIRAMRHTQLEVRLFRS